MVASLINFLNTWAEISSGLNSLLNAGHLILILSFKSFVTWYGSCLASFDISLSFDPIKRFTEKNVFSGLITACRFAIWPTNNSCFLVYATIEGVVLKPSALIITLGWPPSIAATTEFVVPKSIPTTFAIFIFLKLLLILFLFVYRL